MRYASTKRSALDGGHRHELDLVADELDPGRRLVALMIGLGARHWTWVDARLEAAELGQLLADFLAREVSPRALQHLDHHLRAADSEQVVHGEAIAGEILLH